MILLPSLCERILDFQQGQQLRQQGYSSADLHVHSNCSYDVLPAPEFHPETIYQSALRMGFDFITITDHDTMDAYDMIGWQRERLVPGVEISLLDPVNVGHTIHVNVYELDKPQFKELLEITQKDRRIETFVSYLRAHNLPYTYNHPFWFSPGERPNFRAVVEILEWFPVLEYNMKRVRKKNMMTLWLAYKYNKGVTASTDTHIGKIGRAYSLSPGQTFREFFQNITERRSFIVPQDLTVTNLNLEILQWIEVLFDLEVTLGVETNYTGFKTVDGLINFLANSTAEDYPTSFPLLKSFSCNLAKTGFFSFLYLLFQEIHARRIQKFLQRCGLAYETVES